MAKSSVKVITDEKRIEAIFNRGIVVEILPSKEALFKKLLSGERLKIYIGADPTSNALHLSHAKNFMFLEELRELGHEVIVLFGDFTAQIGDPTDRGSARTQLTSAQAKVYVKEWLAQIKPLLNFDDKENPPRVEYNSKWLSKLSFADVVDLASNFTVQQMIERDMFQKRLREHAPIHLHEFLYPLMQGYDSVVLDVDAELCGTDQIFNALAGRTLLKRLKNKDKFVIVLNLLENPKTGELMSKSGGTGVFLGTSPEEMFGAIMAQPDEMIEPLLINLTRIPLLEKEKIMAMGPRKAKALIAKEIIKKFYGEAEAQKAEEHFDELYSKKNTNVELPEIRTPDQIKMVDLIVKCFDAIGIPKSKTEARRLILQGSVEVDGKKWVDANGIFNPQTEVIKIGRYYFRLLPDWSIK